MLVRFYRQTLCSEILQNNKANGPVENIIEKDELG